MTDILFLIIIKTDYIITVYFNITVPLGFITWSIGGTFVIYRLVWLVIFPLGLSALSLCGIPFGPYHLEFLASALALPLPL